jgi:hypothetical protein
MNRYEVWPSVMLFTLNQRLIKDLPPKKKGFLEVEKADEVIWQSSTKKRNLFAASPFGLYLVESLVLSLATL